MVKVKYLGMPNVLAGREIVPEFIQHDARPDEIGETVVTLLNSETAREQMLANFDEVIARLGESGASVKAAEAIARELGS